MSRLEAENDLLLSLVFVVMKVQAKAMEDRLKDTEERAVRQTALKHVFKG